MKEIIYSLFFLLCCAYISEAKGDGVNSKQDIHVLFKNSGKKEIVDACLKVDKWQTCSGIISPSLSKSHLFFNCPIEDNVVVTYQIALDEKISSKINVSSYGSLKNAENITIIVEIQSDNNSVNVVFHDGLTVE